MFFRKVSNPPCAEYGRSALTAPGFTGKDRILAVPKAGCASDSAQAKTTIMFQKDKRLATFIYRPISLVISRKWPHLWGFFFLLLNATTSAELPTKRKIHSSFCICWLQEKWVVRTAWNLKVLFWGTELRNGQDDLALQSRTETQNTTPFLLNQNWNLWTAGLLISLGQIKGMILTMPTQK